MSFGHNLRSREVSNFLHQLEATGKLPQNPPSRPSALYPLTHYQTTNFRLFQTGRVCRRQFQIWRKWHKVFKWVENTVGQGEIARYEQFLLVPQCFQKASKGVIEWEWVNVPQTSKGVIEWEWVNVPQTILVYNTLLFISLLEPA